MLRRALAAVTAVASLAACSALAMDFASASVPDAAVVAGAVGDLGLDVASASTASATRFDPRAGSAGGFRLAYSDPEAAARDAAQYRVIVLNADAARHIPTIRRNNPSALVLVYQEASFTTTWDPTGISRGVGFDEASSHPEWFLLDRSGDRIESPWWPDNFLMDLSSPSYQRAWATNVADELRRADWDGVFVDDVNWRAAFAGEAPARFPTDDRWRAATRSFLAATMPTVRAGGDLAILNIGEGHAAPGLWEDWLQFADGAMEEHFTNWSSSAGGPFVWDWGSASGWQVQLRNVATAARMGKITLLRVGGVEGDVEAMRYGLASYHLVSDGRQTIAPPRFEAPPSYPEQAWNLGAPTGPYREVDTKVYRRDFTAGTVVVNASNDRTVDVPLGATYLDHAGRPVTSVRLGPTRAALLRSASGPDDSGSLGGGTPSGATSGTPPIRISADSYVRP